MTVRIDCVDSEADFAALLPEWEALWQRVPQATPFQSPAWLLAWWRQFGTGAPRILTARNTRIVGILPLYELPEGGRRKLLPIGIGLSDYIDALVDPARPGVIDRLFAAIQHIPGWDECHLPDLPPGSALAGARCPPALQDTIADTVPCPVLQLPPSASHLPAAVPSKALRDVRQAHKRSIAIGGVSIQFADTDTLAPFMEDLFALHEKRWRTRGEAGVCAEAAVRAFHGEAARSLARAGMLRLYQLKIGERIAAVYYGFCRNGHAYAYLGGFDPDMPRLSPGAQILHHAILDAIAEGAREFHFLRGAESYKYAWGATDRWNQARTFRRA